MRENVIGFAPFFKQDPFFFVVLCMPPTGCVVFQRSYEKRRKKAEESPERKEIGREKEKGKQRRINGRTVEIDFSIKWKKTLPKLSLSSAIEYFESELRSGYGGVSLNAPHRTYNYDLHCSFSSLFCSLVCLFGSYVSFRYFVMIVLSFMFAFPSFFLYYSTFNFWAIWFSEPTHQKSTISLFRLHINQIKQ